VNWSAEVVALVPPPGTVTVTSTVPLPAGEVAVSDELLVTDTVVAAAEPNCTVSPDAKLDPLTVTVVPPVLGPEVGVMPLTVGVGGGVVAYVNWSAEVVALVPPPGTVTVTSTVPLPAGDTAVSELALVTETPVAATDPNFTVSPEAKFDPDTVTVVPPVLGPLVGLMPLTVGAGGGGEVVV
jgi:hypothetical protein